jgi:hypothetical protein
MFLLKNLTRHAVISPILQIWKLRQALKPKWSVAEAGFESSQPGSKVCLAFSFMKF